MIAASITEASFFTYHTKIHDTVKGKLAANKLTSIFPKLQQSFAEGLDSIKSKGNYKFRHFNTFYLYANYFYRDGFIPLRLRNLDYVEKLKAPRAYTGETKRVLDL